MGFMDFLSPGLTVATQAVGGWQQGAQQRREREQKDATQAIERLRQKRKDELDEQETKARMSNMAALETVRKQQGLREQRAFEALRKAGVVSGEYDGGAYEGQLKGWQAEQLDKGKRKRISDAAKRRLEVFDPENPILKATFTDDEDPGYDDAWKAYQARIDDERTEARRAANQKAADDRAELATAARWKQFITGQSNMNQRQQNTEEWRRERTPQKVMDTLSDYDDLEAQAGEVEGILKDAVINKTDVTGRLGGVVPLKPWMQDAMRKGGDVGAKGRQAIQAMKSIVGNLRSGKAFTEPEMILLESFIPNTNGTEADNAMKATQFRRQLQRMIATKRAQYGQVYPGAREKPAPFDVNGAMRPGGGGGGGKEESARDRARRLIQGTP